MFFKGFGYAKDACKNKALVDAQMKALRAAGAEKVDRRELARALTVNLLPRGDTLLVTPLDRLAKSTRDLFNTLDAVAKAGAGFRSLADAWADTTTPHGRLMLTVLGGLAEFERDLIRAPAPAPARDASGPRRAERTWAGPLPSRGISDRKPPC